MLRQYSRFGLFLLLAALGVSSAQQTSEPVFRTSQHLVSIDVVVQDVHGQPVSGLSARDFTVEEDGKPQAVRYFDVHANKDAPSAVPLALPPGIVSNVPDYDTQESLNVILLDTLNTEGTEQTYVRRQMLDFLTHLPPGKPVSLMVLGSNLTVLQGFTGTPQKIAAVARALRASHEPLLTTKFDSESQAQQMFAIQQQGFITQTLVQGLARVENFRDCERQQMTASALTSVSRMLREYPGRKNVLWVSAGFPLEVMGGRALTNDGCPVGADLVPRMSAQLATARVAIYPIDVKGLTGGTLGDPSASRGPAGSAAASGFFARAEEHSTMNRIAEATGGLAYYGSNAVDRSMLDAVRHSSRYYTLSYEPKAPGAKLEFRNVSVHVSNAQVHKIAYRRGYYVLPDKQQPAETAAQEFAAAMFPAAATRTQLPMAVRVIPPDAAHQKTRVVFGLMTQDLTGSPLHDGDTLLYEFASVAWSKDGKMADRASSPFEQKLDAEKIKSYQQAGFAATQELSLPPGQYLLKMGVFDRSTGRIGTVATTVDVPRAH